MSGLTVAQMIAALQKLPQESTVCFLDWEYMQYEQVTSVVPAVASVRVNTDNKGQNPVEVWEEHHEDFPDDRAQRLVAIVHLKAICDE